MDGAPLEIRIHRIGNERQQMIVNPSLPQRSNESMHPTIGIERSNTETILTRWTRILQHRIQSI
jgi:hypothetical protein